MRGVQHDAETRGRVLAALLSGQAVDRVCAEFNLPESTVKRWKRDARAASGSTETNPDEPRKPSYDDLVDEYLRENLTTLCAQQRFFRDTEWLKRQPAADLAVLHGVNADKALRILEAIERAAERAAAVDAPSE